MIPSLIMSFVFSLPILVLSAYLARHYIFTLTALYYRSGQPHYTPHGLVYHPTVSVLIPAHNEEKVIREILQRTTELTYPEDKLEIIVIDDGSTDRTGEIAEEFAGKYEYIKVCHRDVKTGGDGKPAALNEGLKHATGEIVFCFDADYYPQRDILEKMAAFFIDPEIGGVQGRVTVSNEPETLVTRLVALERIGGYRVDQLARDDLRLVPQLGGTVLGVRRSLLEFLGGWDPSVLAEDTDLTFRIYLAGFKIRYVNEAECYEEAVKDLGSYWCQRSRWTKGHMQCAFKHLWPLIRSRNLRLREKIDGVLLLNIYFVPILVGLAWILGIVLYSFFQPPKWITFFWASMSLAVYSTVGNFAPFFEVAMGAYLDKRERVFWLMPLLLLSFLYNILICFKALFDLGVSRARGCKKLAWRKTVHSGTGNSYIGNGN